MWDAGTDANEACSVRAMISFCNARGQVAEVIAVPRHSHDQIAILFRVLLCLAQTYPP